MQVSDLITPNVLKHLRTIISYGVRPEGRTLETTLAKTLKGDHLGHVHTLIDVKLGELGLDIKSGGNYRFLRRLPTAKDRSHFVESDQVWARWDEDPLMIFRRPDFGFDSVEEPEEAITRNIQRAREFYATSAANAGVKEIKSLLVQHSFDLERPYTYFRFSLDTFHLPDFDSAEPITNGFVGKDRAGKVIYKHKGFTEGSQNFYKIYRTNRDDLDLVIMHETLETSQADWGNLEGVKVF